MKLANISAQIIKRASASLVISLLSIALLQLSGCGDSGSSPSGASHPEDSNKLSGVAQKGPFQPGSEVRIEQLSPDAQSTLDTLTTKTSGKNSNFSFTLPEHWQTNSENKPLQLTVKGSFLDESHTANASSITQQVTLNALLAEPKNTSVNLLTHWASLRAKFLMFREGKTLTAALSQATNELYDYSGIANADKLDISEDTINGSDNLQLLLLSGALLDVAKHYQQSSQHVINQIAVDFAEDGKINHQGKKWFKLIQAHIQNNPEDKTRQYAKILTEHLGRKETLSLDELPNIINFVSRPKANLPPEVTVKTGQLVELDGSGSLSASGGSLEYTWVRVDHNNTIPASLNNRFIDKPTLTAPSQSTDLIFALFVTDENGLSDTSLIQVHVRTEQQLNHTPVATTPQLKYTDEDIALSITLQGTDGDGDTLSFITAQKTPITLTNGIVTRKYPDKPTSPELIYTPFKNKYTFPDQYGDSFGFRVSDGSSTSDNEATVTIIINSVNDAPTVKDSSIEVDEDGFTTFSLTDWSDADNYLSDLSIYSINDQVLSNSSDISLNHGLLGFNYNSNQLTYTPTSNYSGLDSFKYRITDGDKISEEATVAITVNSINDDPNAHLPTEKIEVNQHQSEPFSFTLRGDDPEGDAITYVLVSLPTKGALSIGENPVTNTGDIAGPSLNYIPYTDSVGADSFVFRVKENETPTHLSSNVTVPITINAVNTQPTAEDILTSVNSSISAETLSKGIHLIGSDADGDTITYHHNHPSSGSLTGSAPDLTYTPNLNFTGADSFSYVVRDGNTENGESVQATVSIVILNRAPTAVAGDPRTVNTGENVTLNGSGSQDPEGQNLDYKWTQTTGAIVTLSDATAATPNFNAPSSAGDLTFSLEVTDNPVDLTTKNLSPPSTVIITVESPNQPPVINSLGIASASGGGTIGAILSGQTISLTSDVSDPENDGITYSWSDNSAGGTFSQASSATTDYTTPTGISVNTPITLTLTVKDATSADITDTVEITINPAPPIAIITGAPTNPVLPGVTVTLTGSATDQFNNSITTPTFEWSIPSGVTLNTGNTVNDANISFTVPDTASTTVTTYDFSLNVTDSYNIQSTTAAAASVEVNPLPTADPGSNQSNIAAGTPVTLDGSQSASNPSGNTLTYKWLQVGGAATITLDDTTAQKPTFTAPTSADADGLEFQLIVTDAVTGAKSTPKVVTISVNAIDTTNPFIMKVKGTGTGEWTFTIPVKDINAQDGYDYLLDCGNGFTHIADPDGLGIGKCTYSDGLPHDIKIAGKLPRINFQTGVDASNGRDKLIDIVKWGNIKWNTMYFAFYNCKNLTTLTATDAPNLEEVENLSYMFNSANNFNSDISSWDVSNVTNMSHMFDKATAFNNGATGPSDTSHPLSWNNGNKTANVTDMSYMFYYAENFNQSLNNWDVRKVDNMGSMFSHASTFNGDITSWEPIVVTKMSNMFNTAQAFNQPIGSWGEDVSNVTDMKLMFAHTQAFNQSLTHWNIENVGKLINGSSQGSMEYMFWAAAGFNGDITGWNPIKVTDMSSMFLGATAFNQDISGWDVGNVELMQSMFAAATSFNNGAIDPNDTTHPLSWGTNTDKVANMSSMFLSATAFNQGISDWDVGNVTDMNNMFNSATHFNNGGLPLSWNSKTSGVTYMHYMFYKATAFNQNIGQWDVSQVTNMGSMFGDAMAFNNGGQPLSWDSKTGAVTNMYKMFANASAFDQDIGSWDISSVDITKMQDMFAGVKLSTPNYDSLLIGWSGQFTQTTITGFNAGTSKRSPSLEAEQAWNTFVSTFGSVSDGGINQLPVIPSINNSSNGSGQITLSADATDSEDDNSTLSYEWTIVNGGTGTISNPTNSTVTYTPLGSTTSVTIQLTVTDSNGSTTTETIEITLSIDTSNPFVMKIKATGNKFIIPTKVDPAKPATYNFAYKCDDTEAQFTQITQNQIPANGIECTYNDTNTHNISIAGSFPRLSFYSGKGTANSNDQTNRDRLIEVVQWGNIQWDTMTGAFDHCSKLERVPTSNSSPQSSPDLSKVTDMTRMFSYAILFNTDISYWDVNGVTNMYSLFQGASAFNQNLTQWNVSNVENMSHMFASAKVFNQDLIWGGKVSKVTDMNHMFHHAYDFNGDITGWNVSSVTDMNHMFRAASAFNKNVGNWERPGSTVGSVTDMSHMFHGATLFDQNLNSWDVSKVVDSMESMFDTAKAFKGNISNWDVSHVTNMDHMFYNAEAFNQDISGWNVSSVTDMRFMFAGAKLFDQAIGNWERVGSSTLANVTNMYYMFSRTPFNHNINNWNVSKVGDMGAMFSQATLFNQPLNNWNVSSVDDMSSMFYVASAFNQDISSWDVSTVTDMGSMFSGASIFNQDIGGWEVGNVTNMRGMFSNTNEFSQNLNSWNVSSVGTGGQYFPGSMRSMFQGASKFNGKIINWDVSNVPDMLQMFGSALEFDQDISGWDVGKVKDMGYMFWKAQKFNQPIGSWNVSAVTTMSDMFSDAPLFNQDLSNWLKVGNKVTNLYGMFMGAEAFTGGNISGWDVSEVNDMRNMFYGATSFDQDLGSWDISLVGGDGGGMRDIFTYAKLSTANYNSLLIGWADKLNAGLAGTSFSAGSSQYGPTAEAARNDAFMPLFTGGFTDGGPN